MIKNEWSVAAKIPSTGEHFYCWSPQSSFGKSFLGRAVGAKFVIPCHEQMQVSESVGHLWPNAEGKWEWHDGPAIDAFRNGHIVMFEELPKASPEVKDLLLKLTDNSESATYTLPTGETLQRGEGFSVIATGNEDPKECFDHALQKRFTSMQMTRPHPDLIARIAKESPELAQLVDNSYEAGQAQIDCREALRFLKHRKVFDQDTAAQLSFGPRGRDIVQMLSTVKVAKK